MRNIWCLNHKKISSNVENSKFRLECFHKYNTSDYVYLMIISLYIKT